MSYDIELKDPTTKEVIKFDNIHHLKGGTYRLGGSNLARLNVTYNYHSIFVKVLGKEGIRTIYGMSAIESIPILKKAIENLDNNVDLDYWKATEGNARMSLIGLLYFAELRPDGIWDGD